MKSRAIFAAVIGALWLAALVARLGHLQVTRHEHYARKADAQHQVVLDLEPPRGTIYDARGRVLAVSVEVDSVFAVPAEVKDPQATAQRLARILHLDAEELAAKLSADRDFVFVARKLDPPQGEAVRALDLDGIHFLRESKRYYPMRELAAQLLGFVGTDHRGLAGLEAHYDRVVAGRPGRRTVLRDAHRRTLLSPRLAVVEAKPGADLHLTVDATVQYMVEKELAAAVAKFHARGGTAILLDPNTGAILALASAPTYDPNRFGAVPPSRWRIPSVAEPFEPGSTFKMVTAAAVLSHRLLTPSDTLDCQMGGITLAGQTIRDHHPFGLLSMRQVLAKSSNVGTVKLALMLGDQRLYDELRGFGFGERSGVDLPGESPGIVRPLKSWSALSKAYVSFGQEVSVTPLQLARAMGAVANGGRLLRPHVVAAVESEEGTERLDEPIEQGWALTPSVAGELTELLAAVVQDGTGRAAAVDGYGVAGKTGTAQKVIGGRYSHREFIASFVGFAPVGAPRLVGLVALDEPWPVYYGGQVAAPVFSSIAKQVLLYWGVPPRPAPAFANPAAPGDALEVGPLVLAASPPIPMLPASPTESTGAGAAEAVVDPLLPGGEVVVPTGAPVIPAVDVVEEPVYTLEGLPATGWSGGGRR